MNNNNPNPINPQQQNLKKIIKLKPLKLEQLDGVAGGPIVTTGNSGDGNPH